MAAEDYFDPYGADEDDQPSIVECKRCGKGDLQWEADGARWILIEHNGKVHKCDEKRIAKMALADFEVVS
jgi:MoaA/NifB/PqqE/SkfB family radical SAM enzyme